MPICLPKMKKVDRAVLEIAPPPLADRWQPARPQPQGWRVTFVLLWSVTCVILLPCTYWRVCDLLRSDANLFDLWRLTQLEWRRSCCCASYKLLCVIRYLGAELRDKVTFEWVLKDLLLILWVIVCRIIRLLTATDLSDTFEQCEYYYSLKEDF